MLDRLLDFIERIFCHFRKIPTLKQKYLISDSSQVLAELTNPKFDDMFWTSFRLTPQVQEKRLLEKLYSSDFWSSSEIRITEEGGDKVVQFTLAVLTDDDDQWIEYLSTKPERIRLRGPYAPKKT